MAGTPNACNGKARQRVVFIRGLPNIKSNTAVAFWNDPCNKDSSEQKSAMRSLALAMWIEAGDTKFVVPKVQQLMDGEPAGFDMSLYKGYRAQEQATEDVMEVFGFVSHAQLKQTGLLRDGHVRLGSAHPEAWWSRRFSLSLLRQAFFYFVDVCQSLEQIPSIDSEIATADHAFEQFYVQHTHDDGVHRTRYGLWSPLVLISHTLTCTLWFGSRS